MKESISDAKTASGVFVLLALLVTPIGIGYIAGAGFGWLAFAVVCVGIAFRIASVERQKDKEKENVQS